MSYLFETSLNGIWELKDEVLPYKTETELSLLSLQEGWIPTPVPGDIHQGLLEAGLIEEPALGMNSYACAWTEGRSWWFRKTFVYQDEWKDADRIELEVNGLDANAEISLNEHPIGSHRNAFRPFVADIKPYLKPQHNTLLVRLTTGVESITEVAALSPDGVPASTEAGNGRPDRGDIRRNQVRKPQYSFGWDWSPRLATTAIAGDVKIRAMKTACIRNVSVRPERDPDHGAVRACIKVVAEQFHYYRTVEGTITVKLIDAKGQIHGADQRVLLRSGLNHLALEVPIAEPQYWWPNGLGEPHLYRVEVSLSTSGGESQYPAFDWGLRFVEWQTLDGFAVIINGKKLYARGANWIPADLIYARASEERYEALIESARQANFNMLRVWGGGLYEPDVFYRTCDRLGIMVWQDFMFACAPYPDHLNWFRDEVEQEAEYQVRRLSNHACIVLWCGNNENHAAFVAWWGERTQAGAWIYNYLLPAVVERCSPHIPYWNSSPYGGDHPDDPETGDQHPWGFFMMNADMQKRITPEEYDKSRALFVSEFGYVGAPVIETVRTYLNGDPLEESHPTWQHHTNVFEKNTVAAGIRKHYADPVSLPVESALIYSGLVQGILYGYALEAMRFRHECCGSLFWMFNDCWGEVGWTIVDYYLRRKPAWYFVRRAFAPLRLILRANGDDVGVVLANDTPDDFVGEIEVGYLSLDGKEADLQQIHVHAPALSRTTAATIESGKHDPERGLWIARLPGSEELLPGILRMVDFRSLQVTDPELQYELKSGGNDRYRLRVQADVYAHAVHIEMPAGALPEDDYFDLLPGETRQIEILSDNPLNKSLVKITCANLRFC
jgi:beta-mannosidase